MLSSFEDDSDLSHIGLHEHDAINENGFYFLNTSECLALYSKMKARDVEHIAYIQVRGESGMDNFRILLTCI